MPWGEVSPAAHPHVGFSDLALDPLTSFLLHLAPTSARIHPPLLPWPLLFFSLALRSGALHSFPYWRQAIVPPHHLMSLISPSSSVAASPLVSPSPTSLRPSPFSRHSLCPPASAAWARSSGKRPL